MRNVVLCLLALLALGVVHPAVAGNLYIPVVERNGADGAVYDTEVWISNGGQVARSFVTTFLAAGTNGTQREGVVSSARIRVAASGTLRVGNVAPATQHGLLEVDAAPQVLVGARLATTAHDVTSFASLPVISSDNMIFADSAAELLGLERNDNRITDVSVVNLGKTESSCQIALFRSNGSQISAVTVTVQPLSLQSFGDALAGQSGVADARAQVRCNRNFFAFATRTDLATSRRLFIGPAALGSSTLTSPGNASVQATATTSH